MSELIKICFNLLRLSYFVFRISYLILQVKNVTFISDPAHSRRISLFFEYLTGINGDFKYKVVGTEDKNWDKKNYYENKYSLNYALTEVAKLIYGFIKYGILEKLGLDKDFENYFDDELKEAKIMIQKNLYAN